MDNATISAICDASASAVMAVSELRAANLPGGAVSLHAAAGGMLDETGSDGCESGEPRTQDKSVWSSGFGQRNGLGRSGHAILSARSAEPNASRIMKISGIASPLLSTNE